MRRSSHYDARRAISQFERALGLPKSGTVPACKVRELSPGEQLVANEEIRQHWEIEKWFGQNAAFDEAEKLKAAGIVT